MDVKKLPKGAIVRATKQIRTGINDDLVAEKGDVGTVVVHSSPTERWPTVKFGKGSSIVFDDEVESA